jgi:hypothetical protein
VSALQCSTGSGTVTTNSLLLSSRAELSVGTNRVARLMQQDGLRGRQKQRYRVRTTAAASTTVKPKTSFLATLWQPKLSDPIMS